jgi:hypothetical protein
MSEDNQATLIFKAISDLKKDIDELKNKVNELWIARPKEKEVY